VELAEGGVEGPGMGFMIVVPVGEKAARSVDFFSRLSFAMRSSIALGVAPAGVGGLERERGSVGRCRRGFGEDGRVYLRTCLLGL